MSYENHNSVDLCLKSPVIKTSLSSLLIFDKQELKYLVSLEMSVLGCPYVQQHKIFLDFGVLISVHTASYSCSVTLRSSLDVQSSPD